MSPSNAFSISLRVIALASPSSRASATNVAWLRAGAHHVKVISVARYRECGICARFHRRLRARRYHRSHLGVEHGRRHRVHARLALREFPTAYTATNAGGVISVVDSGDYGGILIQKSLTVRAEGADGDRAFVGSGTSIDVDISASDVVSLEGLHSTGGGIVISGGSLYIRNCVIRNNISFIGFGVHIEPSSSLAKVVISDTVVAKRRRRWRRRHLDRPANGRQRPGHAQPCHRRGQPVRHRRGRQP